MHTPHGRLAILVGGGPALGIDRAISAAAIEAVNEHNLLYDIEGFAIQCATTAFHLIDHRGTRGR
jgi:6-phosphofructokinase